MPIYRPAKRRNQIVHSTPSTGDIVPDYYYFNIHKCPDDCEYLGNGGWVKEYTRSHPELKDDFQSLLLDFECETNHFKKRKERVSISVDVVEFNPDADFKVLVLTEPCASDCILRDISPKKEFVETYGDKIKAHSNDEMLRRHRVVSGFDYNEKKECPIKYNHDMPLAEFVIQNSHCWDLILTYNSEILEKCPENSRIFFTDRYQSFLLPYILNSGERNYSKYHIHKKNQISMLTGDRNLWSGHKFRQKVYEHLNMKYPDFRIGDYEFLNLKTGLQKAEEGQATHTVWPDGKIGEGESHGAIMVPFLAGSAEAYEHAKFSIVIENYKEKGNMSERLLDCFLSKTVPIYCGAPDVGEHYLEGGIIQFDSIEHLDGILTRIGKELGTTYYDNMMPYIDTNYKRALHYSEHQNRGNFYSAVDGAIDDIRI